MAKTKARYQYRKTRHDNEPSFRRYVWAIVDTMTPDLTSHGLRIVATGWTSNPITPPLHLQRRIGQLNTADLLG